MVTENTPNPQATAADPAPDPAPQPDAARFAAIARREAALNKEREALKRERDEFMSNRGKAEPWLKKAEAFEAARAQKKNLDALRALGYDDTDIFNMLADLPAPQEASAEEKAAKAASDAAEAKIKAFQDDQDKKASEAQKKRDESLINAHKGEISKFLESNQEKFEYCAHFGKEAEAQAYEIIVEGLRESKGEDLISIEEALQMTEDYLEERDKAMSSIKKRQPKESPAAEETAATPERTRTLSTADPNYKPAPTITRTRTLSNDARATAAAAGAPKNETREQKKERLKALIMANGLRK